MKPHLPHRNPNYAGGVDELAAGARTAAVCAAAHNDSLAPRWSPIPRTGLARLLRTVPDLLAVYCVGAGRRGIVEALEDRQDRPRIVMHDLTRNSRSWLVEDRIDAVIDQNARAVGEQAVFHLLGAIASGPSILPLTHIEPRIVLRENIPKGRLT